MDVILIAAIGENGEMGVDNSLLWHLPGDLPRFKAMTTGFPIIMGRKTFDSIGQALPGRLNIVLSANANWQQEKVLTVSSIEAALKAARDHNKGKAFVIGGGQIYKLFLPYATHLELTEVADAPLADTFFPNFSRQDFKQEKREQVRDSKPHFDYVSYIKN